jgi:hypothetical protein
MLHILPTQKDAASNLGRFTPPDPLGQSAYVTLHHLLMNVGGHVWKLRGDTPLPEGLASVRDVGETGPVGHLTIYARSPMTANEYIKSVNDLGWEYVGRMDRLPQPGL